MGRTDALGTFILSCGHTTSFRTPWPTPRQHVICIRCRTAQTVLKRIGEVHIDCEDCIYHRSFGEDEVAARRRAVYHARRSAHVVTVSRKDAILDVISGRVRPPTYL